MEELNPCRCGGEPTLYFNEIVLAWDVYCPCCGNEIIGYGWDENGAIKNWNEQNSKNDDNNKQHPRV